mgnify:FL=1
MIWVSLCYFSDIIKNSTFLFGLRLMIKNLSFFIFIFTYSFSLANTATELPGVQSKLEKEASCELVSRLAFLAVENFSKDVELDQVKELLDPVLRSAVERLETNAQKKFVETEYERIILETYLTNDLAPKYYAKRYLSLCNKF